MREFISTWLDPISIVIGILLSIPIIWTWVSISFGERRQQRIWHKQARQQKGMRPAILVVDLLTDRDVRVQVDHYRAKDDILNAIPEDRIFTISRNKQFTPDDVVDFQRDMRGASKTIMQAGVDVLHLFYAGPTVAAAMVGSEFANAGCRIILFQHTQGDYINFGPLRALV